MDDPIRARTDAEVAEAIIEQDARDRAAGIDAARSRAQLGYLNHLPKPHAQREQLLGYFKAPKQ